MTSRKRSTVRGWVSLATVLPTAILGIFAGRAFASVFPVTQTVVWVALGLGTILWVFSSVFENKLLWSLLLELEPTNHYFTAGPISSGLIGGFITGLYSTLPH